MSSTIAALGGASARAAKAPRTFARRSDRWRPAWRRDPSRRRSSDSTGRRHDDPSAPARAAAGTCPRSRPRSRSPGTNVSTSTAGRATTSARSSANVGVRSRRPRSFHAERSGRARSSYTIALRARAKASRRPLHSAQRRTGQAPGHPQRSHTGGPIRTRVPAQRSQSAGPGISHAAHRRGSTRPSRSTIPRYGQTSAGFVPPSCRFLRVSRARTLRASPASPGGRPRGPPAP
jgi:hypothetical protein